MEDASELDFDVLVQNEQISLEGLLDDVDFGELPFDTKARTKRHVTCRAQTSTTWTAFAT